jgi:hypothetical protein
MAFEHAEKYLPAVSAQGPQVESAESGRSLNLSCKRRSLARDELDEVSLRLPWSLSVYGERSFLYKYNDASLAFGV